VNGQLSSGERTVRGRTSFRGWIGGGVKAFNSSRVESDRDGGGVIRRRRLEATGSAKRGVTRPLKCTTSSPGLQRGTAWKAIAWRAELLRCIESVCTGLRVTLQVFAHQSRLPGRARDGRLGESHRAAAARVATPRLARPRPTRGSQSNIAWPRASGCQPHSLSPVCQGGNGIAGGQQVATLVGPAWLARRARVMFRFQVGVKVAVKCAVSCRVTAPVAGQRISVRSSRVQRKFGGQSVRHPSHRDGRRAGDVGRSIGVLGSCNKGNKGPKQQRPQHRHHRRHHRRHHHQHRHQHSGKTEAAPRGILLTVPYRPGPALIAPWITDHQYWYFMPHAPCHAMPCPCGHLMSWTFWTHTGRLQAPRTWDNLHRTNRGRNRPSPCCIAAALCAVSSPAFPPPLPLSYKLRHASCECKAGRVFHPVPSAFYPVRPSLPCICVLIIRHVNKLDSLLDFCVGTARISRTSYMSADVVPPGGPVDGPPFYFSGNLFCGRRGGDRRQGSRRWEFLTGPTWVCLVKEGGHKSKWFNREQVGH
jgi:hypothetical protein